MKHWLIFLITAVLICGGIVVLSGPAQNPDQFTGKWYHSETGVPYFFHNGLIVSEKWHLDVDETEIFSGAYSFCKNKIVLFYLTENNVEQTCELQLISTSNGKTLCERTEEGMRTVFYRNKKTKLH